MIISILASNHRKRYNWDVCVLTQTRTCTYTHVLLCFAENEIIASNNFVLCFLHVWIVAWFHNKRDSVEKQLSIYRHSHFRQQSMQMCSFTVVHIRGFHQAQRCAYGPYTHRHTNTKTQNASCFQSGHICGVMDSITKQQQQQQFVSALDVTAHVFLYK